MAKNIKKLFALILAISMVMSLSVNTFAAYGQSVCDEEAHTHENACYALTCGKTEADLDLTCGMEAHEHTEDCHVHGEGCEEACALTPCEIEIHAHDDKCYTSHVHVEECYDFETLTCTLHVHGDECYTTWYGDEVELDVEEGTDGYTYMLFGDITDDGNDANDYYYYETSNHTLKKEVTGGGAVHLITLIDTAKYHGDWTPDGVYNCGESNFDVVYCCDATIRSEAGDYYKRLNLEDSEYFTAEEAKKLRAILANSYPFVSVEEAKAALEEAGFEQADKLDRSELISATQAAVWTIANKDSGDSYDYNQTASTAKKYTWGGYLHDFSNEHKNFTDSPKAYTTPEGVGDRINALKKFLLDQDEVSPKRTQVVISNMEIVESVPVMEKEGIYTVALRAQLNNSGSSKRDDLEITIYVDGIKTKTVDVELGTEIYDLTVEAEAGATIKAVVSGTQILPEGVYFYAPKPEDLDGDGIATSREVSQNLIGVSGGTTPIHAEAEVTLPADETTPVTGALALQKTDMKGEALSGAEFDLYVIGEESKLFVESYEVDNDGALIIENLLPGKYELVETKAPKGFVLPNDVIKFSIDEEGNTLVDADDFYQMTDSETAIEVTQRKETVLTDEQAAFYEFPKMEVTIDLARGDTVEKTISEEIESSVTKGEKPAADESVYDYTETTIVADRIVSVSVSEESITVKHNESDDIEGIQPALKFDRNSTADQSAKKKTTELYTDNGHFHDPSSFTVTDAPDGYPWKYVGHGDYSGHYVSHVKVVYERDEAGNPIKDENGNYIIKELQHVSSGTPLYYGGELVTNPEGPFHYATGTRPQQFLLMNEKGETMYGYCIDLETGAESSTWYAMANLEDNNYYASEEAENHVRNIIMNGYWGTAEGTGSLASLKEALKAAAAAGKVQTEQTVKMVNRKAFTTGYELQEGERHYGNYVYWDIPAVDVTLTDEIIDQMTEGEALDAMQAAIWSWANGSNATLNGVDRAIVGDMYAASSQMSDSLNGKNDAEGAARTKALYQYLMSLDAPQEASVIINDKTFAKDMTLEIGEEIAEGVYAAALKFTVEGERTSKDDLSVTLTYIDDYTGEEVTFTMPLTGVGAAEADEYGFYTISGLELKADEEFEFSLNIYGEQYLEKGAYIFTSEGGTNASQTMVTMAEGVKSVDVTRTMKIEFNVEDSIKANAVRHWSDAKILVVKNQPIVYTVTYKVNGKVVQKDWDKITGEEIPGCNTPDSYYDDGYRYEFKYWKLTDGTEGPDGTVGTTDLVYVAVFDKINIPTITPVGPKPKDDIDIPDDTPPLAEIPELFGDDHFAYIIGYTDGLVHPEANITRAEVATIFFRLLDEEIRNTLMTDVNDFPDVEKGQWYNHAVSTLSSMGIVLGRNDGNFYPNDFITRAEFAAIAARFDPSGNPEGVFFSDIAGHWAEREIIIAANNGWVEGYNGLFRPDDYITRAEAMTLVNRVLHRLPETEHDLLEYMVIWPDNMNVDAWYYLAVQEATNSHDYIRKTDPIYESWTEFIEPYDWSLLEY